MTTHPDGHDQLACVRLLPVGLLGMVDAAYEHPRLAAIYDAMDPDHNDLAVYAAIVEEFGADSVLDIGCGTGTLALLLADNGRQVTAVDPAAAMLDVARGKPGARPDFRRSRAHERLVWREGAGQGLTGWGWSSFRVGTRLLRVGST